MKKTIVASLLSLGFILTGCGNAKVTTNEATNTQEEVVIHLGVPKAVPTLPVLYMMETQALGENVTFNLDYWDSPEQLIAMTQDGEHDVFALPLTVAAKLHNKGIEVELTNVNTWGVTYLVSSDASIDAWEDLAGEILYVPLQSSPPDVMTQYYLNQHGLTAGEDVKIVYSSTSEIAQLLKAGEIEHAVLLEPQVSVCMLGNESLNVVFSYDEEWKKVLGEDRNIPNAGMGAMISFIEENPELIAHFEAAYEEAVEYLNENPTEAGRLAEEYLDLKAEVVETAIPRAGLMYKSAVDAENDLNDFYQILLDFDATTIGGSIPGETFYYQGK